MKECFVNGILVFQRVNRIDKTIDNAVCSHGCFVLASAN